MHNLAAPKRSMTTAECIAECEELSRQTLLDQSACIDRIANDRRWLPEIIGTLHARAVPGFDGWFAAYIQDSFRSRDVRLVVFRGSDTAIGESWSRDWEQEFCKPVASLFDRLQVND